MRKFLAVSIISFLIAACTFNLIVDLGNADKDKYINNEPDIVKKQLLIESAKVTAIGMQAAREMLDRAFFENITEGQAAQAAAEAMVNSGSSEYIEAFEVIVASGEQSAMPHGDGSDDDTNQILPGEVVVVMSSGDFGGLTDKVVSRLKESA